MNQSAGALLLNTLSFANGSRQRLQHLFGNLFFQLREMVPKGSRHGARYDLFKLS